MPTPIAYSIEDYAKLLGVGRSTLYAMIADGLIVARKLGTKSIRIFHEDNIGFRDCSRWQRWPRPWPIATAPIASGPRHDQTRAKS